METQPAPKNAAAGRQLLRHMLAALAYRAAKVFRGAPEGFATFRINESTRTPGQIQAHLGDLLDWGLGLAQGRQEWHDSPPVSWETGAQRFFRALRAFDDYLASDQPLGAAEEKLFQGPIADSFNHVGQIALLRRMAGAPIRAENYFRAEVRAGRVGPEQAPPEKEFD